VALERQRAGLSVGQLTLGGSPATVWRRSGEAQPASLVVIGHGYAGSRQMMRAFALTLAQAGHLVVAFDFHGHGRHDVPMSADVASLEGTTAQLVEQTVRLADAARDRFGDELPLSLLAHSMGTDVVIRAASRLDGVAAVVAVSMYSEAVTSAEPDRLLVISGAREGRLRETALAAARLVDPAAEEGVTVTSHGISRRAVAATGAGHVAVLYHPDALAEARDWIGTPPGAAEQAEPPRTGLWTAALLISVLAIGYPIATLLGPPSSSTPVLPRRTVWIALAAPVLPALAAAVLVPEGALGLSAFGKLATALGVWGGVQAAILWRAGLRPEAPSGFGAILFLGWGLGLFALALDRYGAAFLPTGPRIVVLALLLPATVLYTLTDAHLVRGQPVWLRALARAAPLLTLLAAMALAPRLGIAFTVLPVMVLFWLVYGTVAGWVSRRTGPTTAGLSLGLCLAWAIAASTPLVAAP
jgi:predicted alpha/beta hydrolase family esterase